YLRCFIRRRPELASDLKAIIVKRNSTRIKFKPCEVTSVRDVADNTRHAQRTKNIVSRYHVKLLNPERIKPHHFVKIKNRDAIKQDHRITIKKTFTRCIDHEEMKPPFALPYHYSGNIFPHHFFKHRETGIVIQQI